MLSLNLNGTLDPKKFNSTWLAILITRDWDNKEFANLSIEEQQQRIDKAQRFIESMARREIIK